MAIFYAAGFYCALQGLSDDVRAMIQTYVRAAVLTINDPISNREIRGLGYRPLHVAAIYGNVEAIRILLRFGANMSLKCAIGRTPLQKAFEYKCYAVVDELLTHEWNTSSIERTIVKYGGLSNFHVICASKNYSAVEEFINRGVDVNITVDMDADHWAGYTPLHFAVKSSTYEIVHLLIHHGANVNARTAHGFTPLHCAPTRYSSISMALTLLNNGANVNAETEDHQTVAMMAGKRGHLKYLKHLLTVFDVKLEVTDGDDKNTLLHIASDSHYYEIVKMLLDKGADSNARNKKGRTALHAAVRSGYCTFNSYTDFSPQNDVIEELLVRGCLIDARDVNGCTALHYCCQKDNAEGVLSLLRHGANIDVKDCAGRTPTHHFVHYVSHNIHVRQIILHYTEMLRICGMRRIDREHDYVSQCLSVCIPDYVEQVKISCSSEIEFMKRIVIDPYTSLYQMLGKTPNQMAHYSMNETVQKLSRSKVIEKVLHKYGFIVKRHINNGCLRQRYLLPAVEAFKDLTNKYLPDSCIYRIFYFFDDSELDFIIKAANLKN